MADELLSCYEARRMTESSHLVRQHVTTNLFSNGNAGRSSAGRILHSRTPIMTMTMPIVNLLVIWE